MAANSETGDIRQDATQSPRSAWGAVFATCPQCPSTLPSVATLRMWREQLRLIKLLVLLFFRERTSKLTMGCSTWKTFTSCYSINNHHPCETKQEMKKLGSSLERCHGYALSELPLEHGSISVNGSDKERVEALIACILLSACPWATPKWLYTRKMFHWWWPCSPSASAVTGHILLPCRATWTLASSSHSGMRRKAQVWSRIELDSVHSYSSCVGHPSEHASLGAQRGSHWPRQGRVAGEWGRCQHRGNH